ncbi:hypothetical protein GGI07_001574 [Coemansia sp. Benny D115]|nr:hypothetical protein GGI07_001574 [Coemansia sp. Benny D115]
MIIGYGNTRGTLSLYSTGGGGVAEMALSVPNEIIFGFLTFEGSNVLVTHVSEKISVRTHIIIIISTDIWASLFLRWKYAVTNVARGLAHQRSVAEFFDRYDITVNTTKPTELTPVLLRGKTRHLAIKSFPMSGKYSPSAPEQLEPPLCCLYRPYRPWQPSSWAANHGCAIFRRPSTLLLVLPLVLHSLCGMLLCFAPAA